ncbi:MAG: glycosyltransferase [Desulfitobacteriaceae bacterium]|nr:glycosyltransferase [Desulfitobacteriaceae bacterium]
MSISAVIPAYNEEHTIADIVTVLTMVPEIKEIIVVSDGSCDNTPDEARRAGARVFELAQNMGKGGAMMIGANVARYDIILFLDADLVGLTTNHVRSLIYPIIFNEAEMTIGIFEGGRFATDLAQMVAPYLSGQRALRRELLTEMNNLEASRFGVEVALTWYAEKHHVRVKEIELSGMTHVMKEEKLGLARGLAARMKMYWEIAKVVKRNIHH